MMETQTSTNISTRLERIAKLAKDAPQMAFRTLAHHIDIDLLREAYRLTRKDGAVGVDGQSAAEYATKLEANLESLLNRAKSGTYFAPPVRRVHIPKGDGKETRPLGIPTFEDKVLQRAVAMVLEAVYEQDFLDCSYGFRPGRSAHQLLQDLWNTTMKMGGGWVIEIDIRKYFDTIPHDRLREVIRQRVIDGVLLRLIGKWLNAGVLEDGQISMPSSGTPQGGVISPLLANIFLHTVLDEWFEYEAKLRLDGQAWLFRYADDAVLVFANEKDARRVYEALPKRFGQHGLALHPDKTRLIEFRRPDRGSNDDDPKGPRTFDLLGFTHFWGKSRAGKWVVKRKTARDRFRRTVARISAWCRQHRHDPLRAQRAALARKLTGHYGYFGIVGNFASLARLRDVITRVWCKWLRRRSQRNRLNWDRFATLLKRFPLPPTRLPPHLAISKTVA
jgi:group II intron reverse transcriptase/maturase